MNEKRGSKESFFQQISWETYQKLDIWVGFDEARIFVHGDHPEYCGNRKSAQQEPYFNHAYPERSGK